MKLCPFVNCQAIIAKVKFSCPAHWHLLSWQEKERILESNNAWHSGIMNTPDYLEIERTTINSVQRRLDMAEKGKCRSCGAAILWVRSHKTNSLMPLDAEPISTGNVVLKDGAAHVISGDLFEAMLDGARYQSHFASCPSAAKHRKEKK